MSDQDIQLPPIPEAQVPEELQNALSIAAAALAAVGFEVGAGAIGFIAGGLNAVVWAFNNLVPDDWKAQGTVPWPTYADPALGKVQEYYDASLKAVEAAWDDLYRRGRLPKDKSRASAYLAEAARRNGWSTTAYVFGVDNVKFAKNASMYAEQYIRIRGDYPTSWMQVEQLGWPSRPSNVEQSHINSWVDWINSLVKIARLNPLNAAIQETLVWMVNQIPEYERSAYQYDWRWCSKCQGLFFAGNSRGVCPAGGAHDVRGSSNYGVSNRADAAGQDNWRWCKKCQGLFFADNGLGDCPAGGAHDKSDSGDYKLLSRASGAVGQDNWRWCKKCQGLCYGGGNKGVCPKGGNHDQSGSGNYILHYDTSAAAWIDVELQWQSNWIKGWTHFVTFCSGDHSYVLAYNTNNGNAALARFNTTGKRDPKVTGIDVIQQWSGDGKSPSGRIIAIPTWKPGWTHMFAFQDHHTQYVILYNAATGEMRHERLGDDQSFHLLKAGTWAKGWTHLLTAENDGTNYLIAHCNNDRLIGEMALRVRFDRIEAKGEGFTNLEDGHWSAGWKQINTLTRLGGQPYLLVYNPASGRVRLDRFSGQSAKNEYDGYLLAGASHLAVIGATVIGYNQSTGYVEFYKPRGMVLKQGTIDSTVNGFDIVHSASWPAGWSSIIPFKVPYRNGEFVEYTSHFLAYNATTGLIHINRIGS